MSDTDPCLHLATPIDAAEIARLGGALSAVLYARALARRARRLAPRARVNATWLRLAIWLGLAGLAVALTGMAVDGLPLGEQRLEWLLAALSVVVIGLALALPHFFAWLLRPWPAYWQYLARTQARSMLRMARASVPFEAHYVFKDETVAYARHDSKGVHAQWTRRLHGVRVSGEGFTLLYKQTGAHVPWAILLHGPAPALTARLDALRVAEEEPR